MKRKGIREKIEEFSIQNKISDNCAGPVKKIEDMIYDVHHQLDKKEGECIIYIKKRPERGDYYHCIYGKL
ncbi:MAG: hypothetical protein V1660_03320 [archaeon]